MNAVEAMTTDEPAADHLGAIDWQRGVWSDKKGKYSRQHTWVSAGTKLKGSEAGAVTPAAYHDKTPIDPYNMFVANGRERPHAGVAAYGVTRDVEVERCVDRAYGVLTGFGSGDCWISEVILHPKITLQAGYEMTAATMAHLHEHVPEHCYIARSIKTKVTVRSAGDAAAAVCRLLSAYRSGQFPPGE